MLETVISIPKCTTESTMSSPTITGNHTGVLPLNRQPSHLRPAITFNSGCETPRHTS